MNEDLKNYEVEIICTIPIRCKEKHRNWEAGRLVHKLRTKKHVQLNGVNWRERRLVDKFYDNLIANFPVIISVSIGLLLIKGFGFMVRHINAVVPQEMKIIGILVAFIVTMQIASNLYCSKTSRV